MSDVIVAIEDHAGCITLDRPQALNALTLDMVREIEAALSAWIDDERVHLVVLDGAGERALCAGGDIRALYDAARSGDLSFPHAFFRDEYRLNALIAHYPKPYVALMDGIVMGGGIGLSAHGAYRVVTERSRLAMPETAIGFVPDVGGTWLLAHPPGQLGTYAALTGAQMGAADAIMCGLADHYLPSEALPAARQALTHCRSPDEVQACLARFAQAPPPGRYAEAAPWIGACFAADRVEAIVASLSFHPDPAAREAAQKLAACSPLALKATLRALRQAPLLGRLELCLEQEFRLAMAFMHQPDFVEGVRAAVVDKDRSPRWTPSRLEDVTPELVDAVFAAPGSDADGIDLDDWLASRRVLAWQ